MWPRSEGLQGVNAEWHLARIDARQNAFSTDEFGEIDITKYDLDTAGITGQDNDRSYQWDRPLNDEIDGAGNNTTDIRTLERH